MTKLQAEPSRIDGPAWTSADLQHNPHEAIDKANRVRRMFAAIAHRYDLNNRIHSLGRDQSWRRRAVQLCDIQPTDDVLDVACGTGDLARAFCAARPRSVTGVDFTAEMLDIARAKNSHHAAAGRAVPRYVHADAMALPFDDASFDVVSIAFGIRNVADPAKALREFRRVLKPSTGRLVVLEFSQPRNSIVRWINHIYCNRVMPFTATLIANDRSGAYRYLPKSVSTFLDAASFSELLVQCGVHSPAVHPMTLGVCTAYLARVSG